MATEAGGDQNAKDQKETRRKEREKRELISIHDFQSTENDSYTHFYVQKGKKHTSEGSGFLVRYNLNATLVLTCRVTLARQVTSLNFRSSYLILDSNVYLAHWYGLETIHLK